jgi:hypothetical protein
MASSLSGWCEKLPFVAGASAGRLTQDTETANQNVLPPAESVRRLTKDTETAINAYP